jgi:hypothetical protein
MLSMPPATTVSNSPARIRVSASVMARMPEPQTRLIVSLVTVLSRPARKAAWREGIWPVPPCST